MHSKNRGTERGVGKGGGSGDGRNPVGGHERNFSESAGYESPVDLHVTFVCRRQHITIPGSRGNGVDVTPHTHLCSQIHSRALSQDCVGRGCCCCSRRTCSEFLLLPKPSLCKACILHGRGRHRSLPATALQSGLRGPLRPRFPSSCLPADVFPIKKTIHSRYCGGGQRPLGSSADTCCCRKNASPLTSCEASVRETTSHLPSFKRFQDRLPSGLLSNQITTQESGSAGLQDNVPSDKSPQIHSLNYRLLGSIFLKIFIFSC